MASAASASAKQGGILPSSSCLLFRSGSAPVIMGGCSSSTSSSSSSSAAAVATSTALSPTTTKASSRVCPTSSAVVQLPSASTKDTAARGAPKRLSVCKLTPSTSSSQSIPSFDPKKQTCGVVRSTFSSVDVYPVSFVKATSCKRSSLSKSKRKRSASANLRLDLGMTRHSISTSTAFRESDSYLSDNAPNSAPPKQQVIRFDSGNSWASSGSDLLSPMMANWDISSPQMDSAYIAVTHLKEAIAKRRGIDLCNLGFAYEFEEIPDQCISESGPLTTKVASYPCNASKNRYSNVLPFDHSRVCLGDNCHSESSYVNASFIDGFKSPRAWVAAQGPMPNTFADFWRLVWENHCVVIAMLAREESGRVDIYYPPVGESVEYGDVCVQSINESPDELGVLRELVLKRKNNETGEKEERLLYHLQFTQWPDFGVPSNPQDLLTFRRLVLVAHAKLNGKNNPIVVHCSAGVGRTGTFIALDICLRRAATDLAIDMVETLSAMRRQRMLLVQTLSQYIFIYDALLLALHGIDGCGNENTNSKHCVL